MGLVIKKDVLFPVKVAKVILEKKISTWDKDHKYGGKQKNGNPRENGIMKMSYGQKK